MFHSNWTKHVFVRVCYKQFSTYASKSTVWLNRVPDEKLRQVWVTERSIQQLQTTHSTLQLTQHVNDSSNNNSSDVWTLRQTTTTHSTLQLTQHVNDSSNNNSSDVWTLRQTITTTQMTTTTGIVAVIQNATRMPTCGWMFYNNCHITGISPCNLSIFTLLVVVQCIVIGPVCFCK